MLTASAPRSNSNVHSNQRGFVERRGHYSPSPTALSDRFIKRSASLRSNERAVWLHFLFRRQRMIGIAIPSCARDTRLAQPSPTSRGWISCLCRSWQLPLARLRTVFRPQNRRRLGRILPANHLKMHPNHQVHRDRWRTDQLTWAHPQASPVLRPSDELTPDLPA